MGRLRSRFDANGGGLPLNDSQAPAPERKRGNIRRRRALHLLPFLVVVLVLSIYVGRLVPAGLLFVAKQGLHAEYLSYKSMEIEALSPTASISSCSLLSPSEQDSVALRTDAGVKALEAAAGLDPVAFSDEPYTVLSNTPKRPFLMNGAGSSPSYTCEATKARLRECESMAPVHSYRFPTSSERNPVVTISASRTGNNHRIALIAHPTVDPNTYHAMAYDSTPYCLYTFVKDLEDRGLSSVKVDLWIENKPGNGNAFDVLKSLATGEKRGSDMGREGRSDDAA